MTPEEKYVQMVKIKSFVDIASARIDIAKNHAEELPNTMRWVYQELEEIRGDFNFVQGMLDEWLKEKKP